LAKVVIFQMARLINLFRRKQCAHCARKKTAKAPNHLIFKSKGATEILDSKRLEYITAATKLMPKNASKQPITSPANASYSRRIARVQSDAAPGAASGVKSKGPLVAHGKRDPAVLLFGLGSHGSSAGCRAR
jgi:hypothetical protein